MPLRAELDLILPGYAAVSDNELNRQLLPPTLRKVMQYGRFRPDARTASRLLFERAGLDVSDKNDLPVALLRRPGQLSVCADPCYLIADRSLLRIGSDDLALSEQEAKALIATLQPLFADYGMQLAVDDNNRWSLLIDDLPDVSFYALPDIVGQPLDSQMPVGEEQGRWLQLLNACQMALFEHPVNQQREQAGRLPVNGLWFWGQGELSQPDKKIAQLAGSHPLISALAVHSGINHQDSWQIQVFSKGRYIATAPSLDAEVDLDQQLGHVENYLTAILGDLRRMQLRRVNLYITGAGVYRLNPLTAWRVR